jgi:hypothetical protein
MRKEQEATSAGCRVIGQEDTQLTCINESVQTILPQAVSLSKTDLVCKISPAKEIALHISFQLNSRDRQQGKNETLYSFP